MRGRPGGGEAPEALRRVWLGRLATLSWLLAAVDTVGAVLWFVSLLFDFARLGTVQAHIVEPIGPGGVKIAPSSSGDILSMFVLVVLGGLVSFILLTALPEGATALVNVERGLVALRQAPKEPAPKAFRPA